MKKTIQPKREGHPAKPPAAVHKQRKQPKTEAKLAASPGKYPPPVLKKQVVSSLASSPANTMLDLLQHMHTFPTAVSASLGVGDYRPANDWDRAGVIGGGIAHGASMAYRAAAVAANASKVILDAAGKAMWLALIDRLPIAAWGQLRDATVRGFRWGAPMSALAMYTSMADARTLYQLLAGYFDFSDSQVIPLGPKILEEAANGDPMVILRHHTDGYVALTRSEADQIERAAHGPEWMPSYGLGSLKGEGEAQYSGTDEDVSKYGYVTEDDERGVAPRLSSGTTAPDVKPMGGPRDHAWAPANTDSHPGGSHTILGTVTTPFGPGLRMKGKQAIAALRGQAVGQDVLLSALGTTTIQAAVGGGGAIRCGVDSIGGRLAAIARLYERYMFNTLKVEWEPDVSTATDGSVAVALDTDATSQTLNPGIPQYADLRIYTKNLTTAYWYPKSFVRECPDMDDYQYTTLSTAGTATSADYRQINVGTLYVRPSGSTSATTAGKVLGYITVTYDIILGSPSVDLQFTLASVASGLLGSGKTLGLSQCISGNPLPFFEMCKSYGLETVGMDPAHTKLRRQLVDLGLCVDIPPTAYETWLSTQSSLRQLIDDAKPDSKPPHPGKDAAPVCECFTLIGGGKPPVVTLCGLHQSAAAAAQPVGSRKL